MLEALIFILFVKYYQDEELIKECLNPTTVNAQSFKLYNRAKHVYSESNRVLLFKEICNQQSADSLKVCKLFTITAD